LYLCIILFVLTVPATAMEFTAPEAPESAKPLLPVEQESFGRDLWHIIKTAIGTLEPNVAQAAGTCLSLIALVMLVSVLYQMPGKASGAAEFAGTLAAAGVLMHQVYSMIRMSSETIGELSEYGKMLIPVMTGAMAAQGGITGSAALYAGTAIFDMVLSSLIAKVLVPMVYIFLALAIANSATGEDMLKKLRDFIKWLLVWCLKIVLYIFTGYMGITGVVSGSADAATLKATKLTISGMVPVVGGILSDASEAVIVSAGLMKNAVGVYGLLAIAAIWIAPFLKIGVQYLMLKITGGICEIFGVKRMSGLIQAFSIAMGLLLAMTGAVCIFLLISTVCFMKGVG